MEASARLVNSPALAVEDPGLEPAWMRSGGAGGMLERYVIFVDGQRCRAGKVAGDVLTSVVDGKEWCLTPILRDSGCTGIFGDILYNALHIFTVCNFCLVYKQTVRRGHSFIFSRNLQLLRDLWTNG